MKNLIKMAAEKAYKRFQNGESDTQQLLKDLIELASKNDEADNYIMQILVEVAMKEIKDLTPVAEEFINEESKRGTRLKQDFFELQDLAKDTQDAIDESLKKNKELKKKKKK